MNPITPGTINKAAGSNTPMRQILNAIQKQLLALSQGTGVSLLEPVSGGGSQSPVTQTPPQASLAVTGANGAFNLAVTNPAQTIPATLFHEISYSLTSNFGSPTILPLTPSTNFTYNAPGGTYFWRVRSSYDQVHFNDYRPASGNAAVEAGLQSSDATENNVPLNQSNYATMDSFDNGAGSANVRVFGTSGPGTMYPAVKGSKETILPSATIINVPFGTSPVVAFDGDKYTVQKTLPQVFADGLTPTGAVAVVGSGAVTLPVIDPIEVSGSIVGYNVVNQGNGLTADVTIVIVGTGTGATAGTQVRSGGKLISVGPGNLGSGYGGGTTATVSGGVAAAGTGGGQAIGGNNGRFVYADQTTGSL